MPYSIHNESGSVVAIIPDSAWNRGLSPTRKNTRRRAAHAARTPEQVAKRKAYLARLRTPEWYANNAAKARARKAAKRGE